MMSATHQLCSLIILLEMHNDGGNDAVECVKHSTQEGINCRTHEEVVRHTTTGMFSSIYQALRPVN